MSLVTAAKYIRPGYTGCQKTICQKHTQSIEGKIIVKIVSLIVQQLHMLCTHTIDSAKSSHVLCTLTIL